MGVRVELPAHRSRPTCSTSCASATRGARSGARRRSWRRRAGARARASRASRRRRSSRTRCRHSSISGYQQLGSPPNTASDFNTERDRSRRLADVAERAPHAQDGPRLALGAAQRRSSRRRRPGRSPSTAVGSDLPGVASTGTPLASFLLGQVQTFSIDLQQAQIQERAHFQEYFVQDDWKVSDRLTVNPGLRYTLNFPVDGDQRPDGRLQPADAAARVPGRRTRCAPLKKDNFGPRLGRRLPADRQDRSSAPGYGLVWIEMAGITTPFTHADVSVPADRLAALARHHRRRPSCCRTVRAWRRSRRRRRPASARACSRSTARSAPATCSSGTSRCSAS